MAFEGRWAMMALLVTGLILQSGVAQVNAEWFNVGGDNGWTFPPNGDKTFFNDWAKENTFHLNDTLFFQYQYHSVLEVSEADAESCSTSSPINTYDNAENATVFLDREGFYAFICGFPAHCVANMKLELTVLAPGELAAPVGSPGVAEGPGFADGPSESENGKNGALSLRSAPAVMLGALLAGCAVLLL